MKKLLIVLCLILMVGCTTTGQAYLPHTSRIFHAKQNCVGCYDPNPIVFQSIQAAANSGGIAPCSLCVKVKGSSSQGYTVHNYSASTPITSGGANFNTPSSIYSTTSPNSGTISTPPILNNRGIAENGSYYGEISEATRRPKTVPVRSYYRKDGTYVRGHYRSPPRSNVLSSDMTGSLYKKYSPSSDSFNYNKTYIPPIDLPTVTSQGFPLKGKGLLDERYSNPSAGNSGILPRFPGN